MKLAAVLLPRLFERQDFVTAFPQAIKRRQIVVRDQGHRPKIRYFERG